MLGQRVEHGRRIGHRGGSAAGGGVEAGEQHQAGDLEPVAQLVVHAHRLVRRPRRGGVHPVAKPAGERTPPSRSSGWWPAAGKLRWSRRGHAARGHGPKPRRAPPRRRATRPGARRPKRRVAGGFGPQDRGLSGCSSISSSDARGSEDICSLQFDGHGNANVTADCRTACPVSAGRVRGK